MRLKTFLIEYTDKDVNFILETLYDDCFQFLKECKGADGLLYRGSTASVHHIQKMRSRLQDRRPKDTPEWMHEHLNDLFQSKFGWLARNGVFATPIRQDAAKYGNSYLFFPVGSYKYVWSPEVEDLTVELGSSANEDSWGEAAHENIDPDDYENEFGPDSGKGYWIDSNTHKKVDEPEEYDFNRNTRTWTAEGGKYVFIAKLDYDDWYNEQYDALIEMYRDRAYEDAIYFVSRYKNNNLDDAIESGHEISFNCNEYYLVDERFMDEIINMIEKSTFTSRDKNQLEFEFMK